MPRLKLTVGYEGTRYKGWQLQPVRGGVRQITVQGELERAIAETLGRRAPVHGAGRTDAGVHAEAQVCHVDIPAKSARVDWLQVINNRLDEDIRVLDAVWVGKDFDARKSSVGKRYAYSLWMGDYKAPPRLQAFVWSCPAPDLARCLAAIPKLLGERDFASFQNSGTGLFSTVRTLRKVDILPGQVALLRCPADWPVATLVFEGNGFLRQMVRNIVGLLVWVGQEKLEAGDIPDFIAAKNRRALPSPCAPARGLTLLEVLY